MPIHIGDYKRDTGHLRAAEHGAYLLLLFHHWSTGALPTDDRQLASIACMSPAEWKRAKPTLVPFFDEGWVHGRVVSDLEKANESYQKRAKAGSEGGKAKAKPKPEPSIATAMLKQPITDNQLDDAEDARATSLVSEEAQTLADELLVIAGHDLSFVPPGWCGAGMRVQSWLSQGWQREIILVAVKAAAARKRGSPAFSVQFFENAIAEEIARQSAPLPIVEIREAETLTVTHGKPKSSIIQAADDLCRKLASFDGPPRGADELRGDASEDSPRLLSHR